MKFTTMILQWWFINKSPLIMNILLLPTAHTFRKGFESKLILTHICKAMLIAVITNRLITPGTAIGIVIRKSELSGKYCHM